MTFVLVAMLFAGAVTVDAARKHLENRRRSDRPILPA